MNEKDYEEYLRKYMTKHRISRAEAERHYLVCEYKKTCEEREGEVTDDGKTGQD
jgi:hypothetical protein